MCKPVHRVKGWEDRSEIYTDGSLLLLIPPYQGFEYACGVDLLGCRVIPSLYGRSHRYRAKLREALGLHAILLY
jgi:hypothetical protein